LVVPGDPGRSVLVHRMATEGRGHMPMLGARTVDEDGLMLIRDWIASLPAQPSSSVVVEARSAEADALTRARRGDESVLDVLLATGSGALDVALAIADGSLTGSMRSAAIAKGSALADPLRRDLFERHVPPADRRRTLGADFDRAAMATMAGDAAVGLAVFRAQCAVCHRHGAEGRDAGPDLTRISQKYSRTEVLTHIAEPAALIDPAWHLLVADLKDGTSHSGYVLSRDHATVTLRLLDGATLALEADAIAASSIQRISLMPEGLLSSLTAEEAAGLLEFLTTIP